MGGPKCIRMKNFLDFGSPNWEESTMLRLCCTRKSATAWTMPGLSGHESVKIKSSVSAISADLVDLFDWTEEDDVNDRL